MPPRIGGVASVKLPMNSLGFHDETWGVDSGLRDHGIWIDVIYVNRVGSKSSWLCQVYETPILLPSTQQPSTGEKQHSWR